MFKYWLIHFGENLEKLSFPKKRSPRAIIFSPLIYVIFKILYGIPFLKKPTIAAQRSAGRQLKQRIAKYELHSSVSEQAKIETVKKWLKYKMQQVDLAENNINDTPEHYYLDEDPEDEEPNEDDFDYGSLPPITEEEMKFFSDKYILRSNATHLSVDVRDEPFNRQELVWADLKTVTMLFEEPDPTDAEVWYILKTDDDVVSFPEWATGTEPVIKRILELKGFKRKRYDELMNTIGSAYYMGTQGEVTSNVYEV